MVEVPQQLGLPFAGDRLTPQQRLRIKMLDAEQDDLFARMAVEKRQSSVLVT